MAGENRLGVGKEFLDRVLAKLPEAMRGTVAAELAKPEAQDALGELGDGVLRQADYTRQMNETQAYYQELERWHAANAELVELGKTAKANPNPAPAPPAGTPPAPASTGLTREELEKTLYERERGVVTFMDVANELVFKHFQKFNEIIKVGDLVNDPKARELGVTGVYQAKYGSKWEELATKERNAAIETEVQKRVGEARKQFANQPPYPISPDESSPLDALSLPDDKKPSGDVVDRATAHYEELVRARLSSTT